MKITMCEEFYYRYSNNDIYKMFNTCEENVLRNNKSIPLYNGEFVKIKLNNYITHIVKPAENINIIAQKYNVREDEIMIMNQLTSNKLFIGQPLKIYKKEL